MIDQMQDTVDYQDTLYNAVVDEVNDIIFNLEKQKELTEEMYDDEIEALQKKEDSIERSNTLLEKQKALQDALNDRQRVYRSGIGWTYEANRDAIKQAQKDLDTFKDEDRLNDLEKAKEDELNELDEKIKNWEDYLTMLEYQYNEYERIERQRLLMEVTGAEDMRGVHEFLVDDMENFTDYVKNNQSAFLENAIKAYTDYNTAFGGFLDDYEKNQLRLYDLLGEQKTLLNEQDFFKGNGTPLENFINNQLNSNWSDSTKELYSALTGAKYGVSAYQSASQQKQAEAMADIKAAEKSGTLKGISDVNGNTYKTSAEYEAAKAAGTAGDIASYNIGGASYVKDPTGYYDPETGKAKTGTVYGTNQTMTEEEAARKGLAIAKDEDGNYWFFDVSGDAGFYKDNDGNIKYAEHVNTEGGSFVVSADKGKTLSDMGLDVVYAGTKNIAGVTTASGKYSAQDLVSKYGSQNVHIVQTKNDDGTYTLHWTTDTDGGTYGVDEKGTYIETSDHKRYYGDPVHGFSSVSGENIVGNNSVSGVQPAKTGQNNNGITIGSTVGSGGATANLAKAADSYGLTTSKGTSASDLAAAHPGAIIINDNGVLKAIYNDDGKNPSDRVTINKNGTITIEYTNGKTATGTLVQGKVDANKASQQKTNSYSKGIENGPVTYTGLAMLHGSLNSPEYVLNSAQAGQLLYNMATKDMAYESVIEKFTSNSTTGDAFNINELNVQAESPQEFFDQLMQVVNGRYSTTKNRR